METIWPVRLFSKSILKQTKFKQITKVLGPTAGLHCLDIGSDNGVFSYLFRQQGGSWKSADLDERSVLAMKELVKTDVYQIDGETTPFHENEFDCVVIVDFLEHIPDDAGFMREVYRILKPGGTLILNGPNIKQGILMKFRQAIGLTEEEHGHLRPGYTLASFVDLLGDRFTMEENATYTKFFSKFIDTMMVVGFTGLKKYKRDKKLGRGVLITGKELEEYNKLFRFYALVYPIVWLISKLDHLLIFNSGYMLIARAHSNKTLILGQDSFEERMLSHSPLSR
jgi:2-polyprenyl-3-methyl-5-hydroxy-6-metoxy-1,4-benzoquinol methylase